MPPTEVIDELPNTFPKVDDSITYFLPVDFIDPRRKAFRPLTDIRCDQFTIHGQLEAENEKFDSGMRNMAFQLSAGGYNAEILTADQLIEKVQWGINNMTEMSERRINDLLARIAELEHGRGDHKSREGKRERFEKWVMATKHPTFGFLDGRSLARGDDRTGYADEYVQGLWIAYLAFSAEKPVPGAVVLPERKHDDAYDATAALNGVKV